MMKDSELIKIKCIELALPSHGKKDVLKEAKKYYDWIMEKEQK